MSVRARGFSLIELLVALAVFAALAAAAYGGLAQIAQTRGALARQQDRFAEIVRAVSMLERDLRQAVSRPVRGRGREDHLPALAGTGDRIELTRIGFANPLAEPRSNLERVAYAVDGQRLMRGRYAALDRPPDAAPVAASGERRPPTAGSGRCAAADRGRHTTSRPAVAARRGAAQARDGRRAPLLSR